MKSNFITHIKRISLIKNFFIKQIVFTKKKYLRRNPKKKNTILMARRAARVIGRPGRRAGRTGQGREKLSHLLLQLGLEPGLDLGIDPGLDLGVYPGLEPGLNPGLDLGLNLGLGLGLGLDLSLEPGLEPSLHVGLQLLHVSPQLRQLISNPRSSSSGGRRGTVSQFIGKHSQNVAAKTVDAALSDPTYSLEEHLSLLDLR